MRTAVLVLPVILGLMAGSVSACSTDDDGGDDSGYTNAFTSCSVDTRKDVYTQGLKKTADGLEVVMVDSAFTPSSKPAQPGQVQKGMNAITVEVLDAAKAPVDGATVKLDLWMPDHGHGSARAPVTTAMGGGKYRISEVWLPMAGLWRFTIQVNQGGQIKSSEFNFCLDG